MYKRIQQELVCPICKSKFTWHIKNEDEDQIYDAEAICDDCGCSYPICSGMAFFLKPKYNDLRIWKKCDRSNYKKIDDSIKKNILEKGNEELSQEELLVKIALIENAEIEGKDEVAELYELYFYKQGMEKSLGYIYDLIKTLLNDMSGNEDDIVLDFASGRGLLAYELSKNISGHLVVSDINPLILEKCSNYIESYAYDKKAKVSYIAFDMKMNPFRDGGVDVLTTLFGLQNILHTKNLLHEIARITKKVFYTISSYCETDYAENVTLLKKYEIYDVWRREILENHLIQNGFKSGTKMLAFVDSILPPDNNSISSGFAVTKFPCVETTIEYALDKFQR